MRKPISEPACKLHARNSEKDNILRVILNTNDYAACSWVYIWTVLSEVESIEYIYFVGNA